MYTQVTHKDIEMLSSLPKVAILVYLKCRIYGGATGEAFPSRQRLSEELDVSMASINRAFSVLTKEGLLSQRGRVGNAQINKYAIKKEKSDLAKMTNATDQKREVALSKNDKSDLAKMTSSTYQKREVALSKNDRHNKEENKEGNKEVNREGNKPSQKKDSVFHSLDGSDERDIWLSLLWNKHSLLQGWKSRDVSSTFAGIKAGYSVIQVMKAVKKFDAYLSKGGIKGKYRGWDWDKTFIRIWLNDESDTISSRDAKRMAQSTLNISIEERQELEREAYNHQKEIKRAADIAMLSDGGMREIWARFSQQYPDHETKTHAIFEWRRAGNLTNEMLKEMEADDDLYEFWAICTLPLPTNNQQ